MRGIKTILMIPAAVVLLLAGACTNNALDDIASADVVLEILSFANPPVTADADPMTGGCTLTVTDWVVSLSNEPKNSLAGGLGNDIAMIEVLISYDFPAGSPAPRIFGLGGQVIQTGASGNVTFPPIALQDLGAALLATTGSLLLEFRAQTLEGTAINMLVTRPLSVEACV